MQARQRRRKDPVTIAAGATIGRAAELMDRMVVGAVVVVDGDGRPVGIVTDRDIVVRAVARDVPADARVDSIMTTDVVTLDAAAEVDEALTLLYQKPFRRLPLVEDGRMVGMLTVDDLALDLVDDLGSLMRPVFGQVLFGTREPDVPVPTA